MIEYYEILFITTYEDIVSSSPQGPKETLH